MFDGQNPVRFLALGDSYTIGEQVSPHDRFPNQVKDGLESAGIRVNGPHIIARTGWTTDELAAALAQRQPDEFFEFVTLLIGVNNQYRGYPSDTYRNEFRELLRKAIAYAGGKPGAVLVLSIPDWGVTPFAADRDRARIARDIDLFNQINLEESTHAGVPYLDVTDISRRATQDPALVASDGLHPSGKMYSLWAERILKHLGIPAD